MIIRGNNNEIKSSKVHSIRIEQDRTEIFNLVAYSLNKNKYNRFVLGKYKFYNDAVRNLHKIYNSEMDKLKICEIF
jgi:hypothetical protein